MSAQTYYCPLLCSYTYPLLFQHETAPAAVQHCLCSMTIFLRAHSSLSPLPLLLPFSLGQLFHRRKWLAEGWKKTEKTANLERS